MPVRPCILEQAEGRQCSLGTQGSGVPRLWGQSKVYKAYPGRVGFDCCSISVEAVRHLHIQA